MSRERISPEEALELLRTASTAELAARAAAARRARHGRRTHFVHSHNINPTNRCVMRCRLCAYWREEGDGDFLLSLDDARRELERAQGEGLTDLHIVGGMVPELDLDYYERLFSMAREMLPGVLLQGMTAVEIHWIAEQAGVSVEEALRRLQAAGFGAISGGGAEIFHPEVRSVIAERKIDAETWLAVHRTAHRLGIPTNATMLFGHIERDEHIVDHLDRLRRLQDETGGFLAAIPLPFQADGRTLGVRENPSGDRILRVAALTRLYLDNFPHVRMLVNYVDRRLLGLLMEAGVDDIGGTSLRERIARAAGAPPSRNFSSPEEMAAFIRDHGFEPVLTDSAYRTRREIPPPDAAIPEPPERESAPRARRPSLYGLLERAAGGKRLDAGEALRLWAEAPLWELGGAADLRRREMVPGGLATYVVDKNLNTTNACETGCLFCAFHVEPGSPEVRRLSVEEVLAEAKKAEAAGATQILVQGGLDPACDLAYYEACFRAVSGETDLWIHSLSPAEIDYLARREGISLRACLERLRAAGLRSLPGGGAEILVDAVRARISPRKISARRWFEVMETAHELGMRTTATMVYGFGETLEQRVEHLLRVRELQDRTGGFTAFIPWSFSPDRTRLRVPRRSTAADYLRVIALARLVLDNVVHLQAGWVTEGPDIAQIALQFGADDFGGVLMTEEVVGATGLRHRVTEEQVVRLIRDAGWTPARRTTQYEILSLH